MRPITLILLSLITFSCVSKDAADKIAGNPPVGVASTPSPVSRPLLLSSFSAMNFPTTNLNNTSTLTAQIINAGNVEALIGSVLQISGPEISILSDNCTNSTLPIGASCSLTVNFTPIAVTSYSGLITISYDGEKGTYELPIPYNGSGSLPQPQLNISPASWDFGSVASGTTSTKTFIISNSSSGAASMTAATITGTGYSITSDLCVGQTLASSSSTCTITVSYSPSVPGSALGRLMINYTNDTMIPATSEVNLSGIGNVPQPVVIVSPSPYNFGNVATNSSATYIFTVSNNTTVSAVLGTLSVSGNGYTIVSNNCNSNVLSAGANCSLSVRYSPASLGAVTGAVTIPYTSSQGLSYSTQLNLGATGVNPSVSFSFTGFTTNPSIDSSNLSSTGVRLNWTAQSAASYYKLTRNGGTGGTVISANIFPSTVSSYDVTGLSPGTTYQFKINAFDSNGTSDNNNNWTLVTTPGVAGATFNGWSDVVALGSVYTDIGMVDTISMGNTGANRLERNLAEVAGFDPTNINTTSGQIVVSSNPFKTGQKVTFYLTDNASVAPSGFIHESTYYVISLTSSTIKLADTVDDALAGVARIPASVGTGNFALMSQGVVKIGWDLFSFTPSGVASSYNIYRSTSPSSGFAIIGTSSTNSFSDYDVADETNYYYYVHPVVSGTEVIAATASDSTISVYVPPKNMSLVHRWIANREACTSLLGFTWPSGISRSTHYSCAYTWGGGYAPNTTRNKSMWDIGYSYVVDRWQTGCKMSPFAGSVGTAVPVPGLGSAGSVYFKTGTGISASATNMACYYKDPSLGWRSENSALSSTGRNLIRTNYPGYSNSPTNQNVAYSSCQSRVVAGVEDGNGNTRLRLPRMYEMTIMKAANGTNVNKRTLPVLSDIFNGVDLPVNGSCSLRLNNVSGAYLNGMTLPAPSTYANAAYTVMNGSYETRACYGRYQISDLWSMTLEWTGSQMFIPNIGTSYFMASSLDAGDNMIENFMVNNVMASGTMFPSGTPGTNNMLPLFGILSPTADPVLGTKTITYDHHDYGYTAFQYQGGGAGTTNGVYSGGSGFTARGQGASSRFAFRLRTSTSSTSDGYGELTLNHRCMGQVPN